MASGECALVEPGFLRAAARFYYTAIHRESKKFHFRRVAFFVTPLPSYDDEATHPIRYAHPDPSKRTPTCGSSIALILYKIQMPLLVHSDSCNRPRQALRLSCLRRHHELHLKESSGTDSCWGGRVRASCAYEHTHALRRKDEMPTGPPFGETPGIASMKILHVLRM